MRPVTTMVKILSPRRFYHYRHWRLRFQHVLRSLFPRFAYGVKAWRWRSRWTKGNYQPAWGGTVEWKELQEALAEGWIAPGASILDIGCGSGEVAQWLAEQGFAVVGIDYAPGAIEKAREQAGGHPTLSFEVLDICRSAMQGRTFDVFLDRGCFHNIPAVFTSEYVRNVAASAAPDSRVLLLMPVSKQPEADSAYRSSLVHTAERRLRAVFEPFFTLVRIEESTLQKQTPHGVETIPAVSCRFVRQGSPTA